MYMMMYSLDTPPGTKVSIKGSVAIVNGFMLLKKSSMEVLGGRVEGLHKKWSSMKVGMNSVACLLSLWKYHGT